MKKAALFDLDGVLIDSEEQYSQFWASELDRLSPGHGLELANEIKGMTGVKIYAHFFPDAIERQAVKQRMERFQASMTWNDIPGSGDFVRELRRRGVKTAIVTSSDRAKMKTLFNSRPDLPPLFDAILTSEDFAGSKPDPDCYLTAASRLGVPPAECVGFEDSINGLRAVNAAKMLTIGLATTNPASVVSRYASIVIANFRDDNVQLVLQEFEQ